MTIINDWVIKLNIPSEVYLGLTNLYIDTLNMKTYEGMTIWLYIKVTQEWVVILKQMWHFHVSHILQFVRLCLIDISSIVFVIDFQRLSPPSSSLFTSTIKWGSIID